MNDQKAGFRPYTRKACNLRRSISGDAICIGDDQPPKDDRLRVMGRYLPSAIAAVRVGSLNTPF